MSLLNQNLVGLSKEGFYFIFVCRDVVEYLFKEILLALGFIGGVFVVRVVEG